MNWSYPNIDPVAVAIGPLEIRWYALAYLVGILLGWFYALYIVRWDKDKPAIKGGLTTNIIDDFVPWAVIGVVFGGRLGYVLFYQSGLYLEEPMKILQIWQGGMSFHGGALGVIIAMILYAWRKKIHVLRLTDVVCAAVPIGLFFGRIANFVNGELYGRVTTSPLGMVFPGGGTEPRHPSQLYEAALEGLVLWLILFFLIRKESIRNKPGLVSGAFLLGYALARSVVELFRQPDDHIGFIAGTFTMGQLLSVPMIVGGGYLVIRALRKHGTTEASK